MEYLLMAIGKSDSSKISLILTGIGICITFSGLWFQYYSFTSEQTEANRHANRESYYKQLALDVKYSDKTFTQEYPEKNLKIIEIPKIRMTFYQGFPVGLKSFSGRSLQELKMLTDVQYDVETFIKAQEKENVSELSLEITPSISITDESSRFYYSVTYFLVTDFTNKKQLLLNIYIIPKLGKEVTTIQNAYLWNEDYSLLKETPTYYFMEDNRRLDDGEKIEAGKIIHQYTQVYAEMLDEVKNL